MPPAYKRNMKQFATYWAPSANDGFGKKTFAAPIVVKCRWQDDQQLMRDAQGQEFTTNAIVYPEQDLALRGMLAEGDLSDQFDSDGALLPSDVDGVTPYEIRQKGKSPNLRVNQVLHKVFV